MKYFLISGEASGDLHASALIESLRRRDPEAQFEFLGGDLMARAAGREPVIHYRDMAYMGFTEVLKHLGTIRKNFAAARDAIRQFSPDCVILIDYPSFNLKMAKFAKSLGLPVFYYIPPKIWAWKQWRVKTIRKVVDHVFAIFPFEVDFYRKHGYESVTYVGNPSVQEIDQVRSTLPDKPTFLARHSLPEGKIIALLPGSRVSEIRENLPLMVDAARRFPDYQAVVSAAPGIDVDFYRQFTDLPLVVNDTYALVANADAALVTSGTATLETALIGTPQVAMYQGGGSKMLYNFMKHLLTIPYVTLPNLVAGREVITELLMHLCTADAAASELSLILSTNHRRTDMEQGYRDIRARLGRYEAPDRAAEIMIDKLKNDFNRGN